MTLMCAYQNCLCVRYPCSSIAFFRLPTDGRRSTWIKNSGNKSLLNISATAHRFFCENHFRECDILTQFNRKLLKKTAVPIEYEPSRIGLELESKKTSCYARLSEKETDHNKQKEDADFVIETLEDDPNIPHFYEEVITPDLENQHNENINEEHLENEYNLIDCYLQADQYYEQASSNAVDSSTLHKHFDKDVDIEPEMEPQAAPKKRKLNESVLLEPATNENSQVITSSNDYQEDKHFALSLVGYFQRLPKAKKAVAKLKILQYLTELDIGLTENL